MSRNNKSQFNAEPPSKEAEELTFKEMVQNAMILSLLAGFFCLAWLWDSGIQHFFDFLPRPWVITGAVWLILVPTAYGAVLILFYKRREMWGWIHARIQRVPAQNDTKKRPEGVLGLLPAPSKAEYERSGQGYAKQVPPALEHVGLTQGQRVKIVSVTDGPAAAQVVISLPPGLRLSRLQSAVKDIQVAIGAPALQVQSGPKAYTASLIITHDVKHLVVLREILESPEFKALNEKPDLPVPIGVDPVGKPILIGLTTLAHILVAGATNSGKSWWLNQLLVTWTLFRSPEQLRLVLIDPKMVELSRYAKLPHVIDVVYDPAPALMVLDRAIQEMERRYKLFFRVEAENLAEYQKVTGKHLPHIGIVIDEIADLFSAANKNEANGLENAFMRLAQKARAAGIHLVGATQRPSADVIPSRIRTNFPSRICFSLTSPVDYKTVFGFEVGTTLTGKGDGLAKLEGYFDLVRFQGVGIGASGSDTRDTIKKILAYWQKRNVTPASVPSFDDPDDMDQFTAAEIGGEFAFQPEGSEMGNLPLQQNLDLPRLQHPEDRLRGYICRLVLEAAEDGEEDVFMPPRATVAREISIANAALGELLDTLETDGWLSSPERIGKTQRRRILINSELAKNYL